MPLDDSISETMAIIKPQDDVAETIVERVKPLRFAEQNGSEWRAADLQEMYLLSQRSRGANVKIGREIACSALVEAEHSASGLPLVPK